jgi:hypothetical protein
VTLVALEVNFDYPMYIMLYHLKLAHQNDTYKPSTAMVAVTCATLILLAGLVSFGYSTPIASRENDEVVRPIPWISPAGDLLCWQVDNGQGQMSAGQILVV